MLLLANFFWGLSFPLIKAIMLLQERLLPAAGPWFSAVYTVAPRFLIAIVVMLGFTPSEVGKMLESHRYNPSSRWARPAGRITLVSGSVPMRQVDMGWLA